MQGEMDKNIRHFSSTYGQLTDELVTGTSPFNVSSVLEPMGLATQETTLATSEYKGYPFDIYQLKKIISDPNIETKIQPVLISFSGIPESGKALAVQHILDHYVKKSPFTVMTKTSDERLKADGIAYYELVAATKCCSNSIFITEVTRESSIASGILSAFKQNVVKGKVPLLSDLSLDLLKGQGFECGELDEHLQYIYQFLHNETSIPKGPDFSIEDQKYGDELKVALPEGIALINIWDFNIKKAVRHFLDALQGHLYNNHSWLFLDLEKDYDQLDMPPEVPQGKEGKNDIVLMNWRPRIHYLLRSCWISECMEKKRKEACVMFAKHTCAFNGSNLKEKLNKLENRVQAIAEHIGMSEILEKGIETIVFDPDSGVTAESSQSLYTKFRHVICKTSFENVPVAWVFLRSLFYRSNNKFVSKTKLLEYAKKCNLNETSLKNFCKFYTSFGSIFDLSLVNPEYMYVIVKPIGFLKSLNDFLYPSEESHERYPTLKYGLFPQKFCKEELKEDLFAYVDALVCLNLTATVGSARICWEDSKSICDTFDSNDVYYYLPLSRIESTVTNLNHDSIHLLVSIDTPYVFKSVTFTKYLLTFLPRFKIKPCKSINQTIFECEIDQKNKKSLDLCFHGAVIGIHLSEPDEEVCSAIVKCSNEIKENCKLGKAKYAFVVLCVNNKNLNVQSIPSSRYHILPDEELCEECHKAGKTESKLLKVWNEALTKNKLESKPPVEDLNVFEFAKIATTIAPYDNLMIAEILDLKDEFDSLKKESNRIKLINKMLIQWDIKHQSKKTGLEPRRALARKLSQIGDRLSHLDANYQEDIKEKFVTMAKELDAYYIGDY